MNDNKQYPDLPPALDSYYDDIDKKEVFTYSTDQMRVYVDADRAMRAAQPQEAAPKVPTLPPSYVGSSLIGKPNGECAINFHFSNTEEADKWFESVTEPQEAAPSQDALTQAAKGVLAERQRQISVEGWTPEHDDEKHLPDELALAAASYVCADAGDAPPAIWPWDRTWWKPRDRRRNLVKSGALILAELERLDRAAARG